MSSIKRWTEKSVEVCKAEVKAELEAIELEHGDQAKAERIGERIKMLESAADSEDRLKLYVYLVSSLVHHTRYQNLSEARIRKTIQLASSILRAQGIREGVSRLSFLHGELQYITSQIEWQRGHHWAAAWYQYLGEQVSRGEGPGGEGFQNLAMANRALRLGYTDLALEGFSAIQFKEGHLQELCWTNQLKALRLSTASTEHAELLSRLESAGGSPNFVLELQWERALLDIRNDGDYSRLISLTRRGKSHFRMSYIIECSLWLMAANDRKWQRRMRSLQHVKRSKDLDWRRDDAFLSSALALQDCYDYEIPISLRLKKLGQNLTELGRLVNIEKELLCWAAATRFLQRSRIEGLARLAGNAYRSHSLTLSQGRSSDVLELFNQT